jgi:hypothetical protein
MCGASVPHRSVSAAVALLVLASASPSRAAFAQTAQQPPPQQEQQQPPPAAAEQPPRPAEEIPAGIELTDTGYTYEARGRRDPFLSLVQGVALEKGARPPGLAGMMIQEVSLRGIVKTSSGFIAMIQGTDNKSYFARVGERLYDGSIETIVQDKVVFRQEINDPLRVEKFQKVEKSLHPVEEGK